MESGKCKVEREKVIKGLECCIDGGAEACLNCPYCADLNVDDFGKTHWHCRDLRKEALALIKGDADAMYGVPTGPRLLTWQEFITAPHDLENSVPFVIEQETPNKQTNDGWLIEWVGSNEYMYPAIAEMCPYLYNRRYYPNWKKFKTCGFRAWTAMPTKEQREAALWEATPWES